MGHRGTPQVRPCLGARPWTGHPRTGRLRTRRRPRKAINRRPLWFRRRRRRRTAMGGGTSAYKEAAKFVSEIVASSSYDA